MDMLFWNIFEKSGDINAFLAYKDFEERFTKKSIVDKWMSILK